MEEESEKVMALKKGYVEIIMNMAKEAAARIMVSERKAHQYHHDLSWTKDEALRLLIRLKQAMDCKINEVEMRSQDQQRKIEELEAQLQEAEDIVSNLRVELTETHIKLDELENNHICISSNVVLKPVDENGSSQPAMGKSVLVSQEEMINNGSLKEYGYSCEPEVPSIIIKTKQPEMYRNGCTQRVRACDGKLSKGFFSQAGELNHFKNVKELREDEDGETICVKTPVVADTICLEEEKPVEDREVEDDETDDLIQYLKLLRNKRTKDSRFKRKTPVVADTSCVEEEKPVEDKEIEDDETDDLMQYLKLLRKKRSKDASLKRKIPVVAETICLEEEKPVEEKEVEDDETDDLMQYLKLLRKKRTKDSRFKRSTASVKRVSHVVKESCSDLSTSYGVHGSGNKDNGIQSNSHFNVQSDEMGGLPENGFSFQRGDKMTKILYEYINKDGEESTLINNLNDTGSKRELEMKNPSLNLVVELPDTCDGSSGSPKDKILKYTFQRKRKKDSVVSSDDSDLLIEEISSRKKLAKNLSGTHEPLTSS